jgi:hypothetical protein
MKKKKVKAVVVKVSTPTSEDALRVAAFVRDIHRRVRLLDPPLRK